MSGGRGTPLCHVEGAWPTSLGDEGRENFGGLGVRRQEGVTLNQVCHPAGDWDVREP